jgi:hypothetical protein
MRLEHSQARVHAGLAAGDHGLLGVVEVGRGPTSPLSRAACSQPAHRAAVQAQHGGHRARAHRHRLLHGLGAEAHQRHASASVSAPAATSALYSPSECPATATGSARLRPARRGSRRRRPSASRLRVGGELQRSFGPSWIRRRRCPPSAAEASSSVARTAGWSPQASSMPTDCEPCRERRMRMRASCRSHRATGGAAVGLLRSRAAPRPR